VKERPKNVGADVAGCTAGGTAATEDAARAPSAEDAGFRSGVVTLQHKEIQVSVDVLDAFLFTFFSSLLLLFC
jgi:hypothetical protein